jgi:hypothetical protein
MLILILVVLIVITMLVVYIRGFKSIRKSAVDFCIEVVKSYVEQNEEHILKFIKEDEFQAIVREILVRSGKDFLSDEEIQGIIRDILKKTTKEAVADAATATSNKVKGWFRL